VDSWCCKSPLGLLLYAFRAAVFEPAFVFQGTEEPLHEKRKRLKKWRMASIQTTRTALRQKLILSAKYIYKDRMWPDGRRHQIDISGFCYSSHWLPGFHSNASLSKWKQKNCMDFLKFITYSTGDFAGRSFCKSVRTLHFPVALLKTYTVTAITWYTIRSFVIIGKLEVILFWTFNANYTNLKGKCWEDYTA